MRPRDVHRLRAIEGRPPTEEDIERAQTGDHEAFERLAARHLADLYRLSAAMVGLEDGRDAVQDTLVTAWRDLPRLREPDRLESWLRSILMNRCRNILRARGRRPTTPLDTTAPAALRIVEDPMRALHARWVLEEALAGVREAERAVLVLHYLADLPMREVASILGMPEGTAKTRLHAGLRKLRADVGEVVA